MVLDLLLTALVYSGPILVFRFLILKKPVNVGYSLLVTIVYGITGYFLAKLLFGTATLGVFVIWSIINFYILSRGDRKEPKKEIVNGPETKTAVTPVLNTSVKTHKVLSVQFCHKCGKQLGEGAIYCHHCGNCVRKDLEY